MNARELFLSIMHYESFDRMPVFHWTGWLETVARWHAEGFPDGVSEQEYFQAAPLCRGIPINLGLYPLFEEEVFEETDEYRIMRQNDGVVAQIYKNKSSIPHYIDFLLKDPSGWPEYKKRLQPDPGRIPADFDQQLESLRDSDAPVAIHTMSFVGFLRNWMGVENMAMASMIHPDFFAETVEIIADLVCWAIDLVGEKIRIDLGWGWEDICFRAGPLIHPDRFRDLCGPGYRKVAERLRAYGCDLYLVDCDGMIEHLIPHWLDNGVNIMFPVEIGAWQADPLAMRRRYGRDLRIFGGIDKLALEKGPAAIDAEIERRMPLMAEGGFVPLPDHLITPDTPLMHVQYYLNRIRALRF